MKFYDVCIIGAGFSGLVLAIKLASAGLLVSLPSDVFGEDIALEWELEPYQNIISYKCKYKLEQSSSWRASGSALRVDEARDKLNNADFKKKIIRTYEKNIYSILIQ